MSLFFEKLEAGDPDCGRVWDTYLNDLAVLLTNLRMALDMNIIIGGEVGRYMEPHLEELINKMTGYDLFQRDIDYVLACRPRNAFTAGAANLALDAFIGTLLEQA
jgi:predicted NBD/HSP70 family sugar kinase